MLLAAAAAAVSGGYVLPSTLGRAYYVDFGDDEGGSGGGGGDDNSDFGRLIDKFVSKNTLEREKWMETDLSRRAWWKLVVMVMRMAGEVYWGDKSMVAAHCDGN